MGKTDLKHIPSSTIRLIPTVVDILALTHAFNFSFPITESHLHLFFIFKNYFQRIPSFISTRKFLVPAFNCAFTSRPGIKCWRRDLFLLLFVPFKIRTKKRGNMLIFHGIFNSLKNLCKMAKNKTVILNK